MTQEEIIIPKGWELSTIGEISKIKGGSKIPSNEDLGTKLHFIKISDMNLKENFQYIIKPNLIITTSKKNIIENSIPPNSILIPKRGGAILTNKKRITSENSLLDPNIMAIIPTSKIEPLFLYYFFLKTDLANFVGGEVVPQLNKYNIEPLEIFYPHDKKTQKQIVAKLDHILGELEVKKKEILSLIEQNKEKIEFFEKNWMSYVIDREIEKHPQRKEWESKKLSEVSNKITDGAHKTPTYVKEGIPFLRVTDIKNKDISWDAVKRIPKKEHEELIKRSKPEFEDILYSKNGTIGRSIVINWKKEFSIFVSLALIKPKRNILNPYFLKMFLDSKSAISQATKRSKTASVTNLHLEEIRDIIIMLPPLPTQKKIVQNIKNAEEKFQLQKKQFENIKNNYDSKINYINHIQSSVLDSVFSGKLLN